jgi:hypothetical protein
MKQIKANKKQIISKRQRTKIEGEQIKAPDQSQTSASAARINARDRVQDILDIPDHTTYYFI